ncbi:hypothetical protein ACH4LN_26920 [Streptomyces albus]|uniref:Uncharacterized protein n=1 Tax=Streptomyces albus TaxID=1888 RepID=A0A6C1C991_9ACTN|nr:MULTISPECIES: hypothetical protein [Streptomyces]KPC95244.1 hypothetical protein ADL27_10905 [Streptomyces sp. NRRL F-6602]EPD93375.1 hypothetical protein HMPREF1486_03892 [Streptomyces sp. HPH0547]QID38960.1 hypothetical protein G3260_005722 [Streptomyces albus]TGG85469.1 hypothetical protein D8771_09805 [Streptomyces albus]UVN54019.1 hypothetical protein NR995_05355 [Streptomyces albus]
MTEHLSHDPETSADEETGEIAETEPEEDILYSAEVYRTENGCVLRVTDWQDGTVQTYPVARRMVDKLPFYLSMLKSKLG